MHQDCARYTDATFFASTRNDMEGAWYGMLIQGCRLVVWRLVLSFTPFLFQVVHNGWTNANKPAVIAASRTIRTLVCNAIKPKPCTKRFHVWK